MLPLAAQDPHFKEHGWNGKSLSDWLGHPLSLTDEESGAHKRNYPQRWGHKQSL